jgi:hypothetical protein
VLVGGGSGMRESTHFFSPISVLGMYGWIPHNAGFGFLDIAGPALGVFASLDRF